MPGRHFMTKAGAHLRGGGRGDTSPALFRNSLKLTRFALFFQKTAPLGALRRPFALIWMKSPLPSKIPGCAPAKVIFPKWPYDQNTRNEKYIYLEKGSKRY